jgi:hypothetical protein
LARAADFLAISSSLHASRKTIKKRNAHSGDAVVAHSSEQRYSDNVTIVA